MGHLHHVEGISGDNDELHEDDCDDDHHSDGDDYGDDHDEDTSPLGGSPPPCGKPNAHFPQTRFDPKFTKLMKLGNV